MIPLEQVVARLEELISQFSASQPQSLLLTHALRIQVGRLSRSENHLSFRIPLLVYASLRGEELPALDLAAAMLLLYAGTDLLDDLADGDMAPEWRTDNASQVQLIAIGFFATLPQLILTQIEAPPSIIVELERAVLMASVRMGAGQRSDICSRDETHGTVDLQSAWDCIEAKSGAAIAMLGEVGAILAGAPEMSAHYAAFGKALGSAFCLMRDCRNLMDGANSTDLINGTRSYPIALHRSGLREEGSRRRFDELLGEARSDALRREEVLGRLSAAGTFRIAGLVIDSCRRRGIEALDRAQPLEPAGSALRKFLEFPAAAAARPG